MQYVFSYHWVISLGTLSSSFIHVWHVSESPSFQRLKNTPLFTAVPPLINGGNYQEPREDAQNHK